jgi:hypothetical protein
MNDDEKTIGLVEFIRLFTLPGEPEEPVTLEGKAWDAEMDMEVPSGEMMTWRLRHPPLPRLQIVPGSNPPSLNEVEVRTAWELPRAKEGEVQTAWDRAQGRCVFVTHYRQDDLQPEFVVDERGVRSLLPDVAEMEDLHLSEEEKFLILEDVEAVNLTWPVSLNEVRAWAERMDYAMAGQAGIDDRDGIGKRKPGPQQRPEMKSAVAMALSLIADGKPMKAAASEAAEVYKVNPETVLRTGRRRRNDA